MAHNSPISHQSELLQKAPARYKCPLRCCNDDEGSLAVIRPDTVDTGWWWSPDTMIPGPGSLTSSASVSSLLSHLPENPPNVECFRFQHKTAQILDRKCFKFFQGDFWSMMNDLSFLIWYHIVIHILFFRSYSEWDILGKLFLVCLCLAVDRLHSHWWRLRLLSS